MALHSHFRPKRILTGLSSARDIESIRPLPKRARFDHRNPSILVADPLEEEGEDKKEEREIEAILELDDIGEGGQQYKRTGVRLEGYDSDSSDENFELRADAKANALRRSRKSRDEDFNDMFADIDEDPTNGEDDSNENLDYDSEKKQKYIGFLSENEIEGQVASSRSGGHVSAKLIMDKATPKSDASDTGSSDASAYDYKRAELDDEIDEELGAGAKKRNAPKLDAFNMQNESEEGKFDKSGNFVRKAADPYAIHDTWLEDSSEADMKRAKKAQMRREEKRRRRDIADDAISVSSLLSVLIKYVKNGETVLEAIARLGKFQQRKMHSWQRNKRQEEPQTHDNRHAASASGHSNKEVIEKVTEAADYLLARGQPDIYEAERGLLMRQFQQESGRQWQETKADPNKSAQETEPEWEYRWTDGRDGGRVNGSYSTSIMRSWVQAGYFGEAVEFKRVGCNGRWSTVIDFD